MAIYCTNCGAEIAGAGNYCPQCGAALNGSGGGSGVSDAVKAAAVVGGTVLGASALSNLAWQMTHRRRPPYYGPAGGPPPRGFGGPPPRGPGGPPPRGGGPGGGRHGGGRW